MTERYALRSITPGEFDAFCEVPTQAFNDADRSAEAVEQERVVFDDTPVPVHVPEHMKEIAVEITHLARRHPQINQRSGVSVRVTTANYESLTSSALRRALIRGEKEAVVRVSDLAAVTPSTAGKVELDTWDGTDDDQVLDKVVRSACSNVFRRHFSAQELSDLVQRFDRGFTVEVGPLMTAESYRSAIEELPGLDRARQKLDEPDTPQSMAAVLEFVLEGLHLSKRLNKTALEGTQVYGG